jgi:hypothetical protein
MINFAPDECGAYGALRASPVHGTRSNSSRVETQTVVPKDGDQRPQCVLSVKKRLCHAGERVAKAESYNERQKMGRKDQRIQDRIYALDIWLLCDTLAGHPQFVHLRVFGRAAFWCCGGNGCRMALEIRPIEPSAVGRVNTRPVASMTPPGGQKAESAPRVLSSARFPTHRWVRMGVGIQTIIAAVTLFDRWVQNVLDRFALTGQSNRETMHRRHLALSISQWSCR